MSIHNYYMLAIFGVRVQSVPLLWGPEVFLVLRVAWRPLGAGGACSKLKEIGGGGCALVEMTVAEICIFIFLSMDRPVPQFQFCDISEIVAQMLVTFFLKPTSQTQRQDRTKDNL